MFVDEVLPQHLVSPAGEKREEGGWLGVRQGQAAKNGSPSLPQVDRAPPAK